MTFEDINPQEASRRMSGKPPHVYLDVRTPQEFAQGHAVGALNVPIAFMGPGGMAPNPDFVKVVGKHLKKDAPLVVGCKMGGRSRRACETLTAAGFTAVANIDGGFSGNPDADDESAQSGWSGSGLPVTTKPAKGATYEELKG
jgi:rhodanese-related sulfurtransferase